MTNFPIPLATGSYLSLNRNFFAYYEKKIPILEFNHIYMNLPHIASLKRFVLLRAGLVRSLGASRKF